MAESGPLLQPEDIGSSVLHQAEKVAATMTEVTSFHSEFGEKQKERVEKLGKLVIASRNENTDGSGGYEWSYSGKNRGLMEHVPSFWVAGNEYADTSEPKGPTVSFQSLNEYAATDLDGAKKFGFEQKSRKKKGMKNKWGGGEVIAISYNLQANDLHGESSGRNNLGGVILMSQKNAEMFREELKLHPELLFDLIQASNGGPLRKDGGIVDDVVLGDGVTIATKDVGNNEKTGTFPPGYKPFTDPDTPPPAESVLTPTLEPASEAQNGVEEEKSTKELMQEMMQKYLGAYSEFSDLKSMRADMSEDAWEKLPQAERLQELGEQLNEVNKVIEARFGSSQHGLFYETFEDFTTADHPNPELDFKKFDITVLAKEYFSGKATDVRLGNFYDETRPLSKLTVPGNARSEFIRKFKEGGVGDPDNKDIKQVLEMFGQNETARNVEDLIVWGNEGKLSYDGLLFDSGKALRLAVGEEVLTLEQANALVDNTVNLLDENAIGDVLNAKGVSWDDVDKIRAGIRHYREEDGFTFSLSEDDLADFPEEQTKHLQGIDLANNKEFNRLTEGKKPIISKELKDRINLRLKEKIKFDKKSRHADHLEAFRDMAERMTAVEDRIAELRHMMTTVGGPEVWIQMPERQELVHLNTVMEKLGEKTNELIVARYGFADGGLYGQMYANPGNSTTRADLIRKRNELFALAKDYFGRSQEMDDKLDAWYKDTQRINQSVGLRPKLTLEQFKEKFKNAGKEMSGRDITALMVEWDEAEQPNFNISLREIAAEAESGTDDNNKWSLKKLLPASVLAWGEAIQLQREEAERTGNATPHERKSWTDRASDIDKWWGGVKKTHGQANPFQGRDIKEWGAIGTRVASDFVPEIGYSLLAINTLGILARERRTKKRINQENAGKSALQKWAIYIEQTTFGKIFDLNADSKLTAGQRASAVAFGAAFSALGVGASEVLTNVVRVPGVRGAAKLVLMRAATQVLLPRAADLVAARVTRKNEDESARREWADVALSTTSLANTVLTTAMTGLMLERQGEHFRDAFKIGDSGSHLVAEAANKGSEMFDAVGQKIEGLNLPEKADQLFHDTEDKVDNSVWGNALNRSGEFVQNATHNVDLNSIKETVGGTLHSLADRLDNSAQHNQNNDQLPSNNHSSDGGQPIAATHNSQSQTPDNTHKTGGGHLAEIAQIHNPDLDKTGVYHFSDGSQINIEGGKITDAILANGQHLNLNQDTVSGQANLGLLNMHIQDQDGAWSPEAVAKAEYLAEHNHNLDLKHLDNVEKPEMPPLQIELGKPETEINVNGGSYWLDENNQVVSVHSDKYGWLQFDPNAAEGGEAWNQFQLANTHQQHGDLQNYSVDQLVNEAHLAAANKVDINDQSAMRDVVQESHDRIDSQTHHEPYTTENTTHGAEFDNNGDGNPDSWWMKDADGKDVAGHLEDGRTLHLDSDFGGIQGEFQGLLHEANPSLSPDRVAHIADVVANKHDLSQGDINDALGNKDVLLTVYHEMVGYSVQDYLVDKFGLNPSVAKDLAFNKLNFSFFEVGDAPILSSNPGVDILESASVRISIDGQNYPYMDNHLENWLIDNGYLKK